MTAAKNNVAGTQSLWNKSFILLLAMGTFSGMASQMVTPLITEYLTTMGVELTLASAVASLMSFAALIMRPISGYTSDRANRKFIMLASSGVTALCVVGYAIAPNVGSLVALRIIHGIAFSFHGVSNVAFSSMFVPRERMGEGMGYIALGTLISSAVSPGLGIALCDMWDYAAVYYISGGLSLLSIIALLGIPYTKPVRPAGQPREKFSLNSIFTKDALLFACMMGLFSCGNGLVNNYSKIIGGIREISNVGVFFTAYAVAAFIVRPFAGKLLDKKGLTIIVIPSYIIAGLSCALIGVAKTGAALAVAGVLKAIGQGTGSPSIQAYCIKKAGQEKAGVIASTCYIGQDLGNTFAPILGAPVVERYGGGSHGYTVLFCGFAVLLAVCGLSLYALQKYIESRQSRKAARQ